MIQRFRNFILFLVGFSIPIGAESVSLGPFRATPFKFVTAALLVLAGLQIAQRAGERVRDTKYLWVFAFGVSWGAAMAMSIIAGLPASQILRAGSTLAALVAYYFLLTFIVRSREDVVLLLWALALGGAVTALPAALGLQSAGAEMAYGERFTGLSGQENRFGADMTVCLALSAALFFTSRSFLAKAVVAGCALLALAGVGLSLSRAAFLSLATMWVFWLWRSGRVGAIRWAVPAVALGIGVLLTAPESVQHRVRTAIDPSLRARDESIQGRFVMGVWSLKAFASNPLLGVGAYRVAPWVHEQPKGRAVPFHTVHNAYLSVAAEQGLLGLVPFLMILGLTWIDYAKCWRTLRTRRIRHDARLQEYATYVVFLQAALLGRVVSAGFHQTHNSKALWTVLALSPVMLSLVRARVQELGIDAEQPLTRTALELPGPPELPTSLPAR